MLYEDNWLAHYGIKGQEWGVRRYQNYDGSLTPLGRQRYGHGQKREFYKKNVHAIKKGWQNTDGFYTDKGLEKFTKNRFRLQGVHETISKEYANFAAEKKWQDSRVKKYTQKRNFKKANIAAQKSQEAQRLMQTIEANRKKLIQKAYEKNYDVRLKDVKRLGYAEATSLARAFISGAVGSLTVSAITKGQDLDMVSGQRLYAKKIK